MSSYRTQCQCLKCYKKYTTKKRKTRRPPAHCKRCGSSIVRVLSYWKVR